MKTKVETFIKTTSLLLTLAGLLTAYPASGATETSETTVTTENNQVNTGDKKTETKTRIIVKGFEPPEDMADFPRKDHAWLGVAFDEAPEALASQLGLDPGVGLVVTYVTQDSPAAKAGLQKNDVLVEFGEQSLVHPAQLRKLINARKEGDVIKLGYYRAGKKQTVSVTLGKTMSIAGRFTDDRAWTGELRDLQRQLREMPVGDTIREQMKTLRESLGNAHIDPKVQQDIRRSMEQARQAYQQAIKNAGDAKSSFEPVKKALEELGKAIGKLGNNTIATMTGKSAGGINIDKAVESLVKTDGSGTITLIRTPKLHLTAHDKTGKLIFDGEIETTEQRDKIPRELWGKVEPLLKKMTTSVENEPSNSSSEEDL